MKLYLALFLVMAVVVVLMPDESESSPARRRNQLQRRNSLRTGRVAQLGRSARRSARQSRRRSPGQSRRRSRSRVGRRRTQLGRRRGRQEDVVTVMTPEQQEVVDDNMAQESQVFEEVVPLDGNALDEPAEGGEMDENVEDVEEEEKKVPNWCNPRHAMGAWLNFRRMKLWCAKKGFTKFGPYGGVPNIEEEEPQQQQGEDMEEAVQETQGDEPLPGEEDYLQDERKLQQYADDYYYDEA